MTRPVVLSGYAAKNCARATHNAFDVTVPEQDVVVSDELQRLFDLGNDYEAAVYATWMRVGTDVIDLSEHDNHKTAHIAATLAAMNAGRLVILGGRLPDDLIGGRSGKPDVLVREQAGPGYHPADVKAHKALKPPLISSRDRGPLLGPEHWVSDLTNPSRGAAIDQHVRFRNDPRDLLQLAHYWRMLQACGHAAHQPWAAIIGTDQPDLPLLAWQDLNMPLYETFSRRLPWNGKKRAFMVRSALDRYDHEHTFRFQIAQVAAQRTGSPTDPAPLVEPLGHDECVGCSWAPVCVETLPADDLSRNLLGALTIREYQALHAHGIATVADLAEADLDSILAGRYPHETAHQRDRQGRLQQAQVAARLVRDGLLVRLKPGARCDLPAARVEVDIDMESTRTGRVYLWGALVTVGDASQYREFSDQRVDMDTGQAELALTRQFLDWLSAECPTATVFHYASVEKTMTRRILGKNLTDYAGTSADPALWVDLLPQARACLESRVGYGLKVVATEAAGFNWRDDDPGGMQSQTWLDQALAGDRAAWTRIVDYNEDDVRATLAVRRFLRAAASVVDHSLTGRPNRNRDHN